MAVIKNTLTPSRNKKTTESQNLNMPSSGSQDVQLVEVWDQTEIDATLAAIERDLAELWRKVRGDAAVAEESNEEDEGIMVLGGTRKGRG
ncbi:hypothetical protein LTR17_005859 [Elasticomyces elasticus]|nr:hypothetical protein LTR17_005859 [Elasticomyces elasticus]